MSFDVARESLPIGERGVLSSPCRHSTRHLNVNGDTKILLTVVKKWDLLAILKCQSSNSKVKGLTSIPLHYRHVSKYDTGGQPNPSQAAIPQGFPPSWVDNWCQHGSKNSRLFKSVFNLTRCTCTCQSVLEQNSKHQNSSQSSVFSVDSWLFMSLGHHGQTLTCFVFSFCCTFIGAYADTPDQFGSIQQ